MGRSRLNSRPATPSPFGAVSGPFDWCAWPATPFLKRCGKSCTGAVRPFRNRTYGQNPARTFTPSRTLRPSRVETKLERMVRLKDIAERAGVSVMTVSKVLRDAPDISAATKNRIRALARQMGYVPDSLAQGLRTRTTKLF